MSLASSAEAISGIRSMESRVALGRQLIVVRRGGFPHCRSTIGETPQALRPYQGTANALQSLSFIRADTATSMREPKDAQLLQARNETSGFDHR